MSNWKFDNDNMEKLVLEFVTDFNKSHNYSPSNQEILEGINVECGISTVARAVNRLIAKGELISVGSRSSRKLAIPSEHEIMRGWYVDRLEPDGLSDKPMEYPHKDKHAVVFKEVVHTPSDEEVSFMSANAIMLDMCGRTLDEGLKYFIKHDLVKVHEFNEYGRKLLKEKDNE